MTAARILRRVDDGWRVEALDGIDGDDAWFATREEGLAWCRELGVEAEIDAGDAADRGGDVAPDGVRVPPVRGGGR